MQALQHVVENCRGNPRVKPYPKDLVHHKIRILQLAGDAVLTVLICRLTRQIAAEQQAGGDFPVFQGAGDLVAGERRG